MVIAALPIVGWALLFGLAGAIALRDVLALLLAFTFLPFVIVGFVALVGSTPHLGSDCVRREASVRVPGRTGGQVGAATTPRQPISPQLNPSSDPPAGVAQQRDGDEFKGD
jgi:hypothetical protein